MKKKLSRGILAALLIGSSTALSAQVMEVDRTKYTDYTPMNNPDWSLMTPARARTRSQRPDHVNNAETKHFPPVFNQDGGSCGSASRICYMFSYELAAYRNLDGSKPENYYPSHFVWLHTNSHNGLIDQGKDAFVTKVGVPSAASYGGQTYSALFGYQEESNNDFGWMQGYDKWYEAMHNRMLQPSNFPVGVGTEEGREAVKNWLWNHNGDDSFQAGGICGIGVASGGDWQDIPKTANNENIGVAGMKYVKQWGTQVDHALTIVGYDDRIEFDLDGDGIYGETEADELGAWIIVNSWGAWWCNGGFVYCPYAYAGSAFRNDGTFNQQWWYPEIYKVRKDYRPLRTIKLEMDYSHRSEIALSAGISADLNATEPEKTIPFVHFTYAGDGNWGNSNPAPEIPMLGRWADGKLHTEPMEFGYDLTDLTSGYDMSQPLKYFFIVDSRAWGKGKGNIYKASIMDYRFDELGLETPFAIGEGIEVKSAGEKTIISVIVQGSSYNKPQNAAYTNGTLTWQEPLRSGATIASYNVYLNGAFEATLPASQMSYTPQTAPEMGEYGVSAVYDNGIESDRIIARIPVVASKQNVGIKFNKAGFTIPDVMATHYDQATIEFWLKPTNLIYYNHTAGPGWGSFMFHTDAYGVFYAGWNTGGGDRATTYTTLNKGQWTHVAIVVDKNKLNIYLNGVSRGSCQSVNYSGVGGFGDLVFSSGVSAEQDGVYDEIRIWKTARSESEIRDNMYTEYAGSAMPQDLVSYIKGDLITGKDGEQMLYDCVGGHHATLRGSYEQVIADMGTLKAAAGEPSINIDTPKSTVHAGIPFTISATYNAAVSRIAWTAEAAGIKELEVLTPTLTFTTAGTHTVKATAYTGDGRSATATCDITVGEAPEVDAAFTMTTTEIPAGQRVTFHATNPQAGYIYTWSMPGADITKATSPSVATSYQTQGTYTVTLTVTAPDGKSKKSSQTITVAEVAPKAAFSLSPAVVLKGEPVTLNDESRYTPTHRKWILTNGDANYIVYADAKTASLEHPGVYDVTLEVSNGSGSDRTTRERALIVTNADSKNGLNFSRDDAMVTADKAPFTAGQSAWTIDWWMNSNWPADNTNGIGEGTQSLLLKTMSGGKMQLYIGGSSLITGEGYVASGEWAHYAVTFNAGKANFYRNGTLIATRTMTAPPALPDLKTFGIGGAETPFKGSIDELRVWGTELTMEKIQQYANAPITDVAKAEAEDKLVLYYDFNQNGGNVQDRTTNGYHGVRTNFGPDGDAWGLSKGVFSLNFGEASTKDITADYLTNYKKSFKDTGKCVNPNLSSRAFGLKGWILENAVTNGNITTGAHIDHGKNDCLTVTTGWDQFAATISDHKVFQTITLPAGYYTFMTEYDTTYEGQCGGSYRVVAKGNTLPTTENLNEALAYTAMKQKGLKNEAASFALSEETTVSLGLLVNMNGNLCMTIQRFTLTQSPMIIIGTTEEIPAGIENTTLDHAATASKGIYDLMGRQLSTGNNTEALAPGVYIIDGRKVVVK